jgi:hypothetical protein
MRTAAEKMQKSRALTLKETRALSPVEKYLRSPLKLIPLK